MYFKQLSGTTGLFNNTSLIVATNSSSTATGSGLTAANCGQQTYFLEGRYDWLCPPGVTSVCVVCVGGGGSGVDGWSSNAGSGGGLGWKNNIAVSAGSTYLVVVGAGGSASGPGNISYFISANTVSGYGGGVTAHTGGPNRNSFGGGWVGDGGGAGGHSGTYQGGGGAGGYMGNGGNNKLPAVLGSGGGAGGGYFSSTYGSGSGGGVGLLGKGSDGVGTWAGSITSMTYTTNFNWGGGGEGGSGGSRGQSGENAYTSAGEGGNVNCRGGVYGGGGGGPGTGWPNNSGDGGSGAVRIIWVVAPTDPSLRQFPSTNTADIS
jgi:hypothetical protein